MPLRPIDFSKPRFIAFGLVAAAALTLVLAAILWMSHRAYLEQAELTASKLVRALEDHTRSIFETTDGLLRAAENQLDTVMREDGPELEAARTILERQMPGHRFLSSLSLRDSTGRVSLLTAMQNAPLNDTSGSDYFRVHRERTDVGTFIGTPLRSQVTGDWLIPISRRLDTARGEFAGVVVAAVRVRFFEEFFRSLQIGRQSIVGLVRNDGIVLVREPDDLVGRSIPPSAPLFTELKRAPAGTYRVNYATDRIERISAYRTVSGFPAIVWIAAGIDDVLEPWYRDLRVLAGIWLLSLALIVGATVILIVQAQRRAALALAGARSEAENQRLRTLLADAVESLKDGFVLYDADDRLVTMNQAARSFTGLDASVGPGTPHADVIRAMARTGLVTVSEGDVESLVRGRQERHRLKQSRTIERRIGDRWHQVSESPTREGGAVVLRTDITALKRANLALAEAKALAEEATRAKSEFLAVMSHEIRTPMNAILGFVDILSRSGLDPEQRHSVDTIRDAAEALMRVISDILDYSKIEAGRVELEEADFAPDSVVAGVVDTLRPIARSRGLALQATIEPEVPAFLRGDAHRLRQVLLNLVGNAVKFTWRGSVKVRVLREADQGWGARLRFEVEDTGVGIPKEAQPRLFTRFSQADSSVSREYGGTGLGLSICKRLVELMGGAIGVDSEAGQGSRFWFTVTLTKGQEPARAVAAVPAAPAGAAAGLPVLVVDDNAANRALARLQLEDAGYGVDVVQSGEEAIAAVTGKAYAVVLMDVQMPGMDGYEATRKIRETLGPALPIVALTAGVTDEDIDRSRAAGMNAHVAKPVDRETMLRTVAQWAAEPSRPISPPPFSKPGGACPASG